MSTVVSISDLALAAGAASASVLGHVDGSIDAPVALEQGPVREALTFCEALGPGAADRARSAAARVIVMHSTVLSQFSDTDAGERVFIGTSTPRTTFIELVERFWPADTAAECVRGPASVDPGAELAADVIVGAGVTIGAGCRIGAGSVLFPGVHLYPGTQLGRRVRIDANSVIGAPGFGFERDSEGRWRRFPQIGKVVIGDDVEIGANTCIDRGALSDTIIGAGSKLDDRVYVAHNARVGENCLLMAGCVVAGRARIDDGAVLSPASSVREGLHIARDAHVGMGAVVVANVAPSTVVAGVPARFLRNGSYWN